MGISESQHDLELCRCRFLVDGYHFGDYGNLEEMYRSDLCFASDSPFACWLDFVSNLFTSLVT